MVGPGEDEDPMSQHTFPAELPLPFRLSRMMSSLWVPQAIYTAAALGVADALADGPRRSEDVAGTVGAHPGALHRLLRALVALELCAVTDDGAFALTPLGACLRAGTRESVRSWALLMGSPMCWGAWGRLIDCMRSGESVPQLDGWGSAFDFRATHPAESAIFDQAMVEMTRHLAGAIAMSYDFAGIRTLVDVGGGHGALLPPILKTHPAMRAVVFDLPSCRDGALRLFDKTGLGDRCEFVGGSFFESVSPAGADAYIVKSVVHDWDDEHGTAILRAIRAAMGADSRLLVVESIVPDRPGTSPYDAMIASTDLNMLIVTGGKERTAAEFRGLLDAAGLSVTRIVRTPAAMSVIEARRA
jgi:O-methyltransferase domain/Dimerisation domain